MMNTIIPLTTGDGYVSTPTSTNDINTTTYYTSGTASSSEPRSAFSIISVAFLIVGVLSNLLVLLTFILRWIQLNIFGFLLLNLALVDVMGCVVLPTVVIHSSVGNVDFVVIGQPNCQLLHFLANTVIAVSALTLLATAVDKCIVLRFPLRQQMAKKFILPIIVLIWTVGTLPGLLYLVNAGENIFEDRPSCLDDFSLKLCRAMNWNQFRECSLLVAFIVQVMTPLFAVLIAYLLIVYEYQRLLKENTNSEPGTPSSENKKTHKPRQRRMSVIAMNQKKNRDETKLLLVLITCFLVCVLPYNVFHLYQLLQGTSRSSNSKSTPVISTLLVFIQVICPLLHPLIYAKLYSTFRKSCKQLAAFPCKLFAHRMQQYNSHGSQVLYMSQTLREGNGSRKSSRASSEGRKYSIVTFDGRKYSRAPIAEL